MTTEANEFFAARSVEVVGGDQDAEDTHHKRLQTERPNIKDKGRIIVTLHFNYDQATRNEKLPRWLAGDSIELLRQYVKKYDDNLWSLADLVALADNVEVEAAK